MNGLVLTAGGARGAYQAGVLKRIGELRSLRRQPSPFQIVAGASAGAINGALIAARSSDFSSATRALARLWSSLEVSDVFRSDPIALAQTARAHAFLRGRDYVSPDDVKALAPDVLRHRVLLTYEAEAESITPEEIIARILDAVPAP